MRVYFTLQLGSRCSSPSLSPTCGVDIINHYSSVKDLYGRCCCISKCQGKLGARRCLHLRRTSLLAAAKPYHRIILQSCARKAAGRTGHQTPAESQNTHGGVDCFPGLKDVLRHATIRPDSSVEELESLQNLITRLDFNGYFASQERNRTSVQVLAARLARR